VDSTYPQVARSSSEEAIEGTETAECETVRLSESNLKQGVATGLKGAYINITTLVFLQKLYYYHLFVTLF
jgi:hypothetical protein